MERQPLIPAGAAPFRWNQAQGRWLLAGLLLLTSLVRGSALWALYPNLSDDPDAYRQIAEGLRKTGVYTREVPIGKLAPPTVAPTAYRPPLYPLCLAALASGTKVEPFAVAGLQFVLGLLTVALVFQLGVHCHLGRWSFLAAMIVACDPILLQQSTLVMTETLATFLAVACLWLLSRTEGPGDFRQLAFAGASMGIAILCRPTFLPWLLLALIVLVAQSANWQQRLLRPAIVLLAAAIMLAPWAVRNYSVFKQPIITTTHGGYTLWLANNDSFYDYLGSKRSVAWDVKDAGTFQVWMSYPPFPGDVQPDYKQVTALAAISPELADDAVANWSARQVILRRPAMFFYSCLMRVGYLWSPLPQKIQPSESTYRVLARYLVCLWYLAVYALAVLGLSRLRMYLLRSPWIWVIALCVAVTAIHAVYWSNMRMRAPLVPVVAMLAAAGCAGRISLPSTTLRR